jgi:iron complex transport system ATP-binding protein
VPPVLHLDGVSLVRQGRPLVDRVEWRVEPDERWVVLGPNGAGKSTLLRLAATYELPTRCRAHVLGRRVGGADLRTVRPEIGYLAPSIAGSIAPGMSARDAVVTGVDATLRRFRQEYTPEEWRRAEALLDAVGCAGLASQRLDRLSDGERQRVLLARALMPRPRLLLLDEPGANLDLRGREHLLDALTAVARSDEVEAVVLVTHRLEEIPTGFTHALLLRAGGVVAAGPLRETLLSGAVAACFGVEVEVREHAGRFTAVPSTSSLARGS